MTATVDDKIVAMSFESSKFESGVDKTIGALDRLKGALKFPNAGKGLEEVGSAADKLDLSHLSGAIDGVKGKFSVLQTAAGVALGGIAAKAASVGASVVKSIALDPVTAGFKNYETQINAVQTIMANTGLTGKKGLGQVQGALNGLNTYANKTVYNFSEMAKNIGTFTAAGVDLKTSTESIKGIANLAALSGSSSEQASTAMYQLSQAIAAGQVHLQDWNSVVNAGMGGSVFQKALANTAQAMGTLKEGSVKLVGPMKQLTINGESFRQALQTKPGQKSFLTSEVLTNTLKQFTGDLSDAQLKAQGFTEAQIKGIQSQAGVALHAATNIKTFTQLTQALKEEVATAWGAIFKTIFGNIYTATTLFSKIHTVAENALTGPIYALNKLLEAWVKLGGRAKAIDAFKNAFKDLVDLAKPVKDAFRDIFPAKTGKDLYDLTVRFDDFTKKLKPSPETIDRLRRTFEGLFALLDIGKQILGGIFDVFGKVFSQVGKGSGGFLDLTAKVGDFLVNLDKTLKSGGKLSDFFTSLGGLITQPSKALQTIKTVLTNFFGGFKTDIWDKFIDKFPKAAGIMQKVLDQLKGFFSKFGPMVGQAISQTNWGAMLKVIEVGLLGGIFVLIKKFISKDLFKLDIGGGLFKNINEGLESLTGNLKAMQTNIKAKTLEEIAISLGILAGSIYLLSRIPEKRLDNALTGITVALGEMLGAMKVLANIGGSAGFIKLPLIAAGMIILAGAIGILSLALKLLSGMNWNQLTKGLEAIGVLLAEISIAVIPISKNSAGMIAAGVGIAAIAVGILILAQAVKQFAGMNWSEMGKGFAGVAGSLIVIAAAVRIMPKGMAGIGIGLLGIGAGVKLIADAVVQLGKQDPKSIYIGLFGLGGALILISTAMRAMPPNLIITAAGLVLVAGALQVIALAVKTMGAMQGSALARGLAALASALVLLAVALNLMDGALGGAAALLVAAAAVRILAPALKVLGGLSWGQIIRGLVALAAAFAVIGIAGTLLAPVSPALLALGAALFLVGAGIALVGGGIALLGTGLAAIAVSGPAALDLLVKAFSQFITTLPEAMKQLATGIIQVVVQFANAAPKLIKAFGKILDALLQVIINEAPKFGQAFGVLLTTAIKVISQNLPKLIQAGVNIVLAILQGISRNIPKLIGTVGTLIANFLNALGTQVPKVIGAGVKLIGHFITGIAQGAVKLVNTAFDALITFLNGLARAIRTHTKELYDAGWNVAKAIIDGILYGIKNLAKEIEKHIPGPLRDIIDVAKKIFSIGSPSKVFYEIGQNLMEGLANGIVDHSHKPTKATEDAAKKILKNMKDTHDKLKDNKDYKVTITPVVDLSKVKKGSKDAKKMMDTKSTIAPVSSDLASSTSSGVTLGTSGTSDSTQPISAVTFNQNNYSPESLSAIEIYRQTRNTVSQLKNYLIGPPFNANNLTQWPKPYLIGGAPPS